MVLSCREVMGKIGAAVLSSRGGAAIRNRIAYGAYPAMWLRMSFKPPFLKRWLMLMHMKPIFTNHQELDKYNVIGIGPGLGKDKETVDALRSILNDFRKPFVIDADALNIDFRTSWIC